jgi:hypothetical protein
MNATNSKAARLTTIFSWRRREAQYPRTLRVRANLRRILRMSVEARQLTQVARLLPE